MKLHPNLIVVVSVAIATFAILMVIRDQAKPHTIVFTPSPDPIETLDHYEVYSVSIDYVGDASLGARTYAVKKGCYFMRTIDKRGTPSLPSAIGCTPGEQEVHWEKKR